MPPAPPNGLPDHAEAHPHVPDIAPPEPETAPAPPQAANPETLFAALEQRVRRLEDVLAQIQEARGIQTPPAPAPAPPVARVLDVHVNKRLVTATPTPPRPAPVATPVPARAPQPRRAWLPLDSLAEARAILRMFVDPRYRLPWWSGRILPIVLAAAILTSKFWLPFTGLPVFGTLLDKAVDLVLAFVLFKVLGHEARRYRETAPDLPPTLRL